MGVVNCKAQIHEASEAGERAGEMTNEGGKCNRKRGGEIQCEREDPKWEGKEGKKRAAQLLLYNWGRGGKPYLGLVLEILLPARFKTKQEEVVRARTRGR